MTFEEFLLHEEEINTTVTTDNLSGVITGKKNKVIKRVVDKEEKLEKEEDE